MPNPPIRKLSAEPVITAIPDRTRVPLLLAAQDQADASKRNPTAGRAALRAWLGTGTASEPLSNVQATSIPQKLLSPNVLYEIPGGWNNAGTSTVYVRSLTNNTFELRGYVVEGGTLVEKAVDVAAGTFAALATGGGGGGVTAAELATVATTLPATAERTAAYTLALADAGSQVPVNAAGATTITVPADADVAFPVGTILEVCQEGTGQLTISGAAGVSVQAPGGAVKTAGQYAIVGLRKKAANTWRVQGGTV